MVDRWSVMVGGKKESPPLTPPWGGESNREEMVSTTDLTD